MVLVLSSHDCQAEPDLQGDSKAEVVVGQEFGAGWRNGFAQEAAVVGKMGRVRKDFGFTILDFGFHAGCEISSGFPPLIQTQQGERLMSEKSNLEELISVLKQQRDELQVKMHLASMESKQEYDRLSDRINDLIAQYEPTKER
jgi:hypothetical protein